MKIVDYKIEDMEYSEMLALYTFDDVMKYTKENAEFTSDDYSVCLQLWLQKKISGDFYNVCAHVSRSSMPTIAAFTTLSRTNGKSTSVLDIAREMDNLQNSKTKTMLEAISNGNIVFVNNVGGYHWRKPDEITIQYELDINEQQLHNFIYNPKNYTQCGTDDEVYFIYYKGKCYTDNRFACHLYLCHKYNIKEDDCTKLIWHKGSCEYGIENLKLSPVYDFNKPILSKQDLDVIEREIKLMNNTKSEKSWKQKLEESDGKKS